MSALFAAQIANAGTAWQPDSATAGPAAPEQVRIVEQGIEHQRDGDGHVFGSGAFHRHRIESGANGLYQIFPAGKDYTESHDFHVDGDGSQPTSPSEPHSPKR